MPQHLGTFIVLFMTVLLAQAGERFIPDVTQKKFEEVDGVVDHLIPATVTSPKTYYIAEFTAYQALSDSYAWRIYKSDDGTRYRIKSWDIVKDHKAKTTSSQNQIDKEISKEVAQLIYEMWANSIIESNYTRVTSMGLDGATYNFSTFLRGIGWMSADTWSPPKDIPPHWLVEAGIIINTVARRDDAINQNEILKLKEINKKLSAYNTTSRPSL